MAHATVFAILAAASMAFAQEPAAPPAPTPLTAPAFLGYSWKGVSSARYLVVTTDTSRTAPEGGVPVEETKRFEMEITLTPSGMEGNATWVEVSYVREKAVFTPGEVSVDSSSAENPSGRLLAPISAVYAAVRDKTVRVLMTPGARIRKVEGVAELVAAARAALPPGWPDPDQALAMMIPVSDGVVAGQTASVFLYLPGATMPADFKRSDKIPSPTGAGELDRKVEVLGAAAVEGRRQIVVRQTLEGNALPPVTVAAQGLSVETARYASESTVWLDADRGIPSRVVTRSERVQTARPTGEGSAVKVPTRIEAATTIESTLIEATAK